MGTVASEDKVISVKGISHTDRGGLLAGGKVGGTGIVVGDTVVTSGGLDEVEHRLELTDIGHVTEYAEQVLFGETAVLDLLLDGLVVLHHRNGRELQLVLLRTQGDLWIYIKRFRHGCSVLFDCECGFFQYFRHGGVRENYLLELLQGHLGLDC